MYINLRTYINLKGMIDMPVIGHHVWGHAYEHDIVLRMHCTSSISTNPIKVFIRNFVYSFLSGDHH